jgi:hypothetical protein
LRTRPRGVRFLAGKAPPACEPSTTDEKNGKSGSTHEPHGEDVEDVDDEDDEDDDPLCCRGTMEAIGA